MGGFIGGREGWEATGSKRFVHSFGRGLFPHHCRTCNAEHVLSLDSVFVNYSPPFFYTYSRVIYVYYWYYYSNGAG